MGFFPNKASGVPPDKEYTSLVLAVTTVIYPNPFIPLFLLAKKAQKKKLGKKKYAVRGVWRVATRDQGFAFGNHNLFEKRLIKNFHMEFVLHFSFFFHT